MKRDKEDGKDKWSCGECGKKRIVIDGIVKDKIECDRCGSWICKECSDFEKGDFTNFTDFTDVELMKKVVTGLKWLCCVCRFNVTIEAEIEENRRKQYERDELLRRNQEGEREIESLKRSKNRMEKEKEEFRKEKDSAITRFERVR